MKDLADMARGFAEFKNMLQGESNGEGTTNPLAALADVARTLSSIYEQLVLLNKNLEHIPKQEPDGGQSNFNPDKV